MDRVGKLFFEPILWAFVFGAIGIFRDNLYFVMVSVILGIIASIKADKNDYDIRR